MTDYEHTAPNIVPYLTVEGAPKSMRRRLNLFKELAHAAFRQCSNELLHWLTIAERNDRRERADLVLLRERTVHVRVNGDEVDWPTRARLRLYVPCELLQDGRECFARAAPVGVEVNEHHALICLSSGSDPAEGRFVSTMEMLEPAPRSGEGTCRDGGEQKGG